MANIVPIIYIFQVFLRFPGDAIKWPTQIPLVGAAHMIMERDSLNTVQVVEILKVCPFIN
jgi:hypothetical protein